jgi:acetylornithine deacetylase/succinyl-diaminopimelate desuccinylase-like protein
MGWKSGAGRVVATNVGAVALLALATFAAHGAPRGPAPDAARLAHARNLYAEIVGVPTVEGLGNVPKVADYLAAQFRAAGFPAEDVRILPLGETASLVVRYRGDGRGGRPILLNAHMDVVAAKREDWERDPFTLVESNGYYYGRGSYDDKLDVATLTETLLRLKAERFVPHRDVILALTGDEETSELTARDLVRNHRDLIDAEFCLSGDLGTGILDEDTGLPAYYQVSGAEKTSVHFELQATNPGGHSSKPRPDNAIYDLVGALAAIRDFRFPIRTNEWTLGAFAAQGPRTPGPLGDAQVRFARDPSDAAAIDALSASGEYVGQLRTTCVATQLAAGHAENALPQRAVATVNCRVFPGDPVEDVRATLQRLAGERVRVSIRESTVTAAPSPLRKDVMDAVALAVHATHPGVPLVPRMEVGASDGAIFREAGIPTYGVQGVFLKASDDYSHGLNERVPTSALAYGLTHWYVLVKELAQRR